MCNTFETMTQIEQLCDDLLMAVNENHKYAYTMS